MDGSGWREGGRREGAVSVQEGFRERAERGCQNFKKIAEASPGTNYSNFSSSSNVDLSFIERSSKDNSATKLLIFLVFTSYGKFQRRIFKR